MLYRCSWTRCLLNLPDFSYFAENVVTFYALTSLRCNCAQKPIQKRDEQNKCIGDDTKAAARQSPICIKKQKKIKYGEKRFAIWRMELLHPAMWHDHDIVIMWYVAPRSWLEFARWQHPAIWQMALGWHAIEFSQTSAISEFYTWFRFRPYHHSRHVILHQSAKFCPNRTTLGRKNDVMSIFKMADLSHLWF